MTYNGIANIRGSNFGAIFVNILDPFFMVSKAVGRNTNNLDVTFLKIGLATSNFSKFSSADRGEVSRMREKDYLR